MKRPTFPVTRTTQKLFKVLYNGNTACQAGSLANYRNLLGRINANGEVKSKFEAHKDFILKVTEALLLEFTRVTQANIKKIRHKNRLPFYRMIVDTVIDKMYEPYRKHPPPEILKFLVNAGQTYNMLSLPSAVFNGEQSVKVQLSSGEDIIADDIPTHQHLKEPTESGDDLYRFIMQLLQWGLHLIDMSDTIMEGDIDRVPIILRRSMPFFYVWSNIYLYFIQCCDYILKTEVTLPERLSMRVKVGSFVNPEGKPGRNKAADMQQENTIKKTKGAIKTLGANKKKRLLSELLLQRQ